DVFFLSVGEDLTDGGGSICEALFIGKARSTVAGKTDNVRKASGGGGINGGMDFGDALGVVCGVIEAGGEGVGGGHGTYQAVPAEDGPFGGFDEVDGLKAHGGSIAGEGIQRDGVEAPTAQGLANAVAGNQFHGASGGAVAFNHANLIRTSDSHGYRAQNRRPRFSTSTIL